MFSTLMFAGFPNQSPLLTTVSGTGNLKKSEFFLVLCCLGDDANITTSNLVRVDDREGENQITK